MALFWETNAPEPGQRSSGSPSPGIERILFACCVHDPDSQVSEIQLLTLPGNTASNISPLAL